MTSIDEQELKKFQKSYNEWSDPSGEFAMLHKIHPIRMEYINSQIEQHFLKKNRSIETISSLDIGCGGGLVCSSLYDTGIQKIRGIDANDLCVQAAQENARIGGKEIEYAQSLVEEEVFQDKKYDLITCLEVIEHVNNPAQFIKNISSLLHKDGILILSTINRNIKSYLLAILMAEYILSLVPKHTHDYNKFLKPSELNEALEQNNLTITSLAGLNFDIISGKWIINHCTDVNYFAVIST